MIVPIFCVNVYRIINLIVAVLAECDIFQLSERSICLMWLALVIIFIIWM